MGLQCLEGSGFMPRSSLVRYASLKQQIAAASPSQPSSPSVSDWGHAYGCMSAKFRRKAGEIGFTMFASGRTVSGSGTLSTRPCLFLS